MAERPPTKAEQRVAAMLALVLIACICVLALVLAGAFGWLR